MNAAMRTVYLYESRAAVNAELARPRRKAAPGRHISLERAHLVEMPPWIRTAMILQQEDFGTRLKGVDVVLMHPKAEERGAEDFWADLRELLLRKHGAASVRFRDEEARAGPHARDAKPSGEEGQLGFADLVSRR